MIREEFKFVLSEDENDSTVFTARIQLDDELSDYRVTWDGMDEVPISYYFDQVEYFLENERWIIVE